MKMIKTSEEARNSIKVGIDKLADLVKVTIGPKGRNIIISKNYGKPVITNDGVTIAKQVQLQDEFQDLGARICRQVAQKTNEEAGDGTTTATILAQAIIQQGSNHIQKGVNAIFLQRSLEKYGNEIVNYIKTLAKDVSSQQEIQQIASISANNDPEIGKIISMAIKQAGIQGVINVEDSKTMDTWLEKVEGMQLNNGFISPYFVTDPVKMQVELENAYILVFNSKFFNPQEMLNLLKQIAEKNSALLMLVEDIQGQALATLVVNKVKGILNVCAVKIPGMGETRKEIAMDICAITGAEYLSKDLGHKLEDVKLSQLGFAKKVIVSENTTVIREGAGQREKIKQRIESIKYKIDKSTSPSEQERLQKRIARILGGVSIIHVGAQTEMQLKQKKYRIEDSLNATKAAIAQGIVPGAGNTLLQSHKYLKELIPETQEEKIAIQILKQAVLSPTKQIIYNTGIEDVESIIKVIFDKNDFNWGYNALTNKVQNLLEAGIIDPVKVVRSALQNAISIAGLFLTTEGIILQKRTQESQKQNSMFNGM